jgi:hypothetical protein
MEVSLQDKDRIFTNLYGFQPWTLDAAKKRGCWDNTKKLLQSGADEIIETGWGRLPHGNEVELHAQKSDAGAPQFSRHQC